MSLAKAMIVSVTVAMGLAGCVSPVATRNAEVTNARLSKEVLTLNLSDGSNCRVRWRAAPVGRLDNCGAGFGYAVKLVDNPNILSRMWTDLSDALGGDGIASPMAEVVITDSMGHDKVFLSPPPLEKFDY